MDMGTTVPFQSWQGEDSESADHDSDTNSLLDAIETLPSACGKDPFTVDWDTVMRRVDLETMVASDHFAALGRRNRSQWNHQLLQSELLRATGS
eukprot:3535893-Rhodomonas_salina.1